MAPVTSGLVAAWDLTQQTVGIQSIAAAHSTAYSLTVGATTGAEGNDCAATTQGMSISTAGADDFMHAAVPDSDLTGALTICIVANPGNTTLQHLVGKNTSASINIPCKFWTTSSADSPASAVKFARANGSGVNVWNGPSMSSGSFQMYSVIAPSDIGSAPSFFVGDTKTVGTSASGSQTGSAPGASADLRIGLAEDASMAAAYTASYVLVYNRELTEAELAQNYAELYTVLNASPISLSLPAPTYTPPLSARALYYARSQGLM
jgi:hypothetical protein